MGLEKKDRLMRAVLIASLAAVLAGIVEPMPAAALPIAAWLALAPQPVESLLIPVRRHRHHWHRHSRHYGWWRYEQPDAVPPAVGATEPAGPVIPPTGSGQPPAA